MPDFWLEVSMPPKGPATGQLDRGFLFANTEFVLISAFF
jgi:hypothetical protein